MVDKEKGDQIDLDEEENTLLDTIWDEIGQEEETSQEETNEPE